MKNLIVVLKKFFSCGFVKKSTITNLCIKDAEGRHEWNDRYGAMHQSRRLWQLAFFSTLMVNAVLGGVLGYIASASKVQPFIVETHEGMPYAVAAMQSTSIHDQRLINFAINQFILNARTVLQDPTAQKVLLDKVYAYAANQTLPFLHDYYQTHQPFDMAQQKTITISIVSSLAISPHLWQVMWDETAHSTDGSTAHVTRWVANVTYQFGEVNPHFINANPFGLYITQLAWTPMVLQGEAS